MPRGVYYGSGLLLVPFITFVAGTMLIEHFECGGADFQGDCDMATLGGFGYAVIAFFIASLVVGVIEASIRFDERQERKHRNRSSSS